jgi:hypothetical protein
MVIAIPAGQSAARGPHVVMVECARLDKDTGCNYLSTTLPRRDPSTVNAIMLALRDHGLRVYRSSTVATDVLFPVTASVIERCRAAALYTFSQGRRRLCLATSRTRLWSAPVTLSKAGLTLCMLR